MRFDKQTDGHVLLDWVHDQNAVIKPDEGRWLVANRETDAVLGEGRTPSDAIIAAANKTLLAA